MLGFGMEPGEKNSVQRILEWFRMRKERRGVAMHVYDLNAVKCLFTWLRNVSGLLHPLEFLEPVITGAENLSVLDNIALFDVLDTHRFTPRSACVIWPLCVAWLPSPCAVCDSRSVVALPSPWANAPRQAARYEA